MILTGFPELYFNVDSGYLEGLVRGFKAGVLSQSDYVNLVQCESLEGEPPAPGAVCCERGGEGRGGLDSGVQVISRRHLA